MDCGRFSLCFIDRKTRRNYNNCTATRLNQSDNHGAACRAAGDTKGVST